MLSDDEYEDMLRKKLLRVDAEIAIIDEDLAKLRAQDESVGNAQAGNGNGDEDARNKALLDLARHPREPTAEDVARREDHADREQIEMARRLRDRLRKREG
jgi:hypothetical protein